MTVKGRIPTNSLDVAAIPDGKHEGHTFKHGIKLVNRKKRKEYVVCLRHHSKRWPHARGRAAFAALLPAGSCWGCAADGKLRLPWRALLLCTELPIMGVTKLAAPAGGCAVGGSKADLAL